MSVRVRRRPATKPRGRCGAAGRPLASGLQASPGRGRWGRGPRRPQARAAPGRTRQRRRQALPSLAGVQRARPLLAVACPVACEELLGGDAKQNKVVVAPAGEVGPPPATLMLEAESLVEADRRLVEVVDFDVDLLVAELAEVEAEEQQDRVGAVALAPVVTA